MQLIMLDRGKHLAVPKVSAPGALCVAQQLQRPARAVPKRADLCAPLSCIEMPKDSAYRRHYATGWQLGTLQRGPRLTSSQKRISGNGLSVKAPDFGDEPHDVFRCAGNEVDNLVQLDIWRRQLPSPVRTSRYISRSMNGSSPIRMKLHPPVGARVSSSGIHGGVRATRSG